MKILLLDIETAPNLVHVWGIWQQNVGINQIIDAGVGLYEVSQLLGHSSTKMSERYAHLSQDSLRKAVGKLGGKMVGAGVTRSR